VCAARHEHSPELYDRRMGCLRQRRLELAGLVAVLTDADAELVRDAPELVADLPELDACADPDALVAITPPASEIAGEVDEIREALAGVFAQVDAGHYAAVIDELAGLRERAEATTYAPLLAEVLLVDSRARYGLGQSRDAGLDELVRSYELALASGDDRQAAAAAIEAMRREGLVAGSHRLVLGRRWNSSAAALSQRVGQPADLEVQRRVAFGRLLTLHVQLDEGIAEVEAAVDIAERSFGPDSLLTARAELAAASALDDASRYAEAAVYLDRAIASYERRSSPDHPLLYGPLEARLSLLRATGKLDEALAVGLRMQALAERSYGPEHPLSLDALAELAIVHDLRGDHRSALASFEAVLARTGEADSIVTGGGVATVNSMCFTRYKLGEYSEAKLTCAKALAAGEALFGVEHPINAVILNNLGLIARAEGEPGVGLAHDRRALSITEATVGPEHLYTGYSLIGVGEGLLALGRRREAIEPLERALAIRTEIGDPGELGEAECLLARARGGDAGRELAEQGLAKLREAGSNWDPQVRACAKFVGEG
jgi:eukaryotic-like serine/threonine-protein kinase